MNPNAALAQQVLLHLAKLGVREVCVAAGARNTPLLTALLASKGLRLWNFFDERSAGFFALGRMMVDRRPVAIVTTSGTAVAELLPSVIEAYYQAVPLVLVTADRPASYRGSGAPQAIEQPGIFGIYAERTLDLQGTGNETAWPAALGRKPVHVNVCFDEPLLGESMGVDFSAWGEHLLSATKDSSAMQEVLADFLDSPADLLVLAAGLHPTEATALASALHRLGAPIMAEATANLHDPALAPLLIRGGEKALSSLKPQRVLRIGAVPSWRWWRDLEDQPGIHVMHLSNAPFPGLARHQGVGVLPLQMLASALKSQRAGSAVQLEAGARLDATLLRHPHSEAAWMRHLSTVIPEHSRVFIGNSLPIREWNLAGRLDRNLDCFACRGANGIDGIVSAFYGTSDGAKEAWLIIGDLSALYDLSAPWITNQLPPANRRIALINNGGGKIFSRVASLRALGNEARAVVENRHELGFRPWADLWQIPYRLAEKPQDLADLPAGDVLIEVRPDPAQSESFWADWV